MWISRIGLTLKINISGDDGRVFVIETLSEIIYNEKKKVLNGVPTFEDCKAAAKNERKI